MSVFDLGRVLHVLSEEHVEFIIVGGVAAALQGAPVLTQDIDILCRIEDGNLERLDKLATTDAFGSTNDTLVYDDLIGSSNELEVTGQRVKVLSLRRLVELKRELGRDNDASNTEKGPPRARRSALADVSSRGRLHTTLARISAASFDSVSLR